MTQPTSLSGAILTAAGMATLTVGSIGALQSHERNQTVGRESAEMSARQKVVAANSPRCGGINLSGIEKAYITTGFSPCAARQEAQRVAAEREAFNNKVAFNRGGRE